MVIVYKTHNHAMHDPTITMSDSQNMLQRFLTGTTLEVILMRHTRTREARHYSVNSPFARMIAQHEKTPRFRIEKQTVELAPGSLLLLPAGLEMQCDLEAEMLQTFAYFKFSYRGALDGFRVLVPERRIIHDPDLADRFRDVVQQTSTASPAALMEARAVLMRMIAQFLPSQLDENSRIQGIERLQPALTYVDENLSSRIRIEQLASAVCLAPNYFISLFSETFGCAPMAYVIEQRIAVARELLYAESRSIEEIAGELGYSNPFYFSRQFRKVTGMSPSEYRRQVEEEDR